MESSFLIQNLEADIINYDGKKDFQVLAEYMDDKTCNIIVKRIDTTNSSNGWSEDISILLCNSEGAVHQFNAGSSPESSTKSFILELSQEFHPLVSNKKITHDQSWRNSYNPYCRHYLTDLSLQEFNSMFETDLVRLPSAMFAAGVKKGGIYQYHESYGGYPWTYEINLTINHIIAVIMEMRPIPDVYFVICAHDGYMEGYYPSTRTVPHKHSDPEEYNNKTVVYTDDLTAYPLLHKNKYVLGQSVHPDTAFTIAMPDRYYFCLNRYNLYRSIHQGLPFNKKKSTIVYAGNARGGPTNFTTRRDININQRDYFKSDAVPKKNIHAPEHIERNDMLKYKYILDIDGNASTWDATAWKLNSNSVILKTDSNWIQWFYDDFKPWIHYVPIKDDFSDIQEKFDWCEDNQEKCKEIIQNTKRLFHAIYLHENVVSYTTKIIKKLQESQN